ncbi:uncharacterized protein CDAR_608521 [Caerostris darwini]|uniref:Uncharacterized protein n=1 Tax=Caerostris darwini TaxID=1538125 RepID=A0AAV4WKE5_9ARAC|nr:uncharacterized protein CDAR_608521 [Caerostris darwini]
MTHLHPGFCESYAHGQLFPHKDVRVVGLGEAPLQLLQLRWREPGPVPLLLDGLVAAAAALALRAVHRGVRGAVQPVQDLQRTPRLPSAAVALQQPGLLLGAYEREGCNWL